MDNKKQFERLALMNPVRKVIFDVLGENVTVTTIVTDGETEIVIPILY